MTRGTMRFMPGLLAAALGLAMAGSALAMDNDSSKANAANDPSTAASPSSVGNNGASASTGSTGTTGSSAAGNSANGSSTPTGTNASGGSTAASSAAGGNDTARKIFDQLDSNHDGSLSYDEFSRATFQHQ
jgi:hypothetical protein